MSAGETPSKSRRQVCSHGYLRLVFENKTKKDTKENDAYRVSAEVGGSTDILSGGSTTVAQECRRNNCRMLHTYDYLDSGQVEHGQFSRAAWISVGYEHFSKPNKIKTPAPTGTTTRRAENGNSHRSLGIRDSAQRLHSDKHVVPGTARH